MKQGKNYLIEWTDTNSRMGWWRAEDIDEESKKVETLNYTLGFFIKYSGSFVVVCMSFCPVEGFAPYGILKWIPIKTIKRIKLLK